MDANGPATWPQLSSLLMASDTGPGLFKADNKFLVQTGKRSPVYPILKPLILNFDWGGFLTHGVKGSC